MISKDESRGEGGNVEGKNEVTQQLKKGPWTAEEDEILLEHVRKFGEGRWSAVKKYTGLARCGKSCRLRWANHLRPDLKKGSITPEEERLILELQDKYGNKWARIAAELPGRTDNEIKNFWNSRIKRRLRANHNQGQQSYSSQHTTTTTSTDFQFQILSSQFPPKSSLVSTSWSSLPFTINRPPPLLSSPNRFKRHRRLSSVSNQTNATKFTGLPSMSTTSLLLSSTISPSLSQLSPPNTPNSGLLSPLGSHNSPMISPSLSSMSQQASPILSLSSMTNSPITPRTPASFSTLSQPSSPHLTLLTRPNSPMLSSISTTNSLIASQAGSQVLSSTRSPGSPILSLVASSSSSMFPGENSSSPLILNQQGSELTSTSSFLFDGVSNDASGYLHHSELPSNQISDISSGIKLDQNVNLASYDALLDDPSQSDVILDLKIKAGWTRGLKKKPRLDTAPASMMNMAMTRATDKLLKEHLGKANAESTEEPTRPNFTFHSGQSRVKLQDSCGLFQDMLKESQAMDTNMTSGTERSLVFTEEKPFQSSAGDDLKEDQRLERISSMHEDLSKILEFDPDNLTIPELYTSCGEISNTQCSSVIAHENLSHELNQYAFVVPPANTYNQETDLCTTSNLDNFPGIQ